MSDEFFRTKMGQSISVDEMPRIAKVLESIAEKLSPAPVPPQEVYVLVYQHSHGTDFGVYHSNEAAGGGVWELMNEYMSEFQERATEDQKARLKVATSPKDLGGAMTIWHEVLEEEEFEIHKRDVE